VLRDGEDRRDVVAGVGVFRGEERVVEVELPHGNAVGPGGPLGRHRPISGQAEDGSARRVRMTLGLRTRMHRGIAGE